MANVGAGPSQQEPWDHYVPRALIREWGASEIFDIQSGEWVPTRIGQAFAERGAYTVELHGEADRTLDELFDAEWNLFCQVARDPLRAGAVLTPKAQKATRRWVASQWARTPSAEYLTEVLTAPTRSVAFVQALIDDVARELPVERRTLARAAMQGPEMLASFRTMHMWDQRREQVLNFYRLLRVIEAWDIEMGEPADGSFVLSDHPVVLVDIGPDGERQLGRPGIRQKTEVLVALGPHHLLRVAPDVSTTPRPSVRWFNRAVTSQAYSKIIARDRMDLPADVILGIRSGPDPTAGLLMTTDAPAPDVIPDIPDQRYSEFVARTRSHGAERQHAVLRGAVDGVVARITPSHHPNRKERRQEAIDAAKRDRRARRDRY